MTKANARRGASDNGHGLLLKSVLRAGASAMVVGSAMVSTAAFAQDHAIRAHAQCVLHQIALFQFAMALHIGRPCFHACDMRLLQGQFGGILDGD